MSKATIWIFLACLFVFANCNPLPKPRGIPMISQRTSWPTETGTMVRILKKRDPYLELQEDLAQNKHEQSLMNLVGKGRFVLAYIPESEIHELM